mmetsp:Transcript_99931/g.188044  ORF Transcript_99931/g.188044 Transcript_99931/m.188044 type:complete len:439 (-) Transcript_99931:66-1382(-)
MDDDTGALMTTYGTVPAKKPSWQRLADPLQLLVRTSISVGKDIVILAVIIWKVFFREMYYLPCEEQGLGKNIALACEYTKAYMRSLPLMGIVILIVVASRQILYQRIYYQMLVNETLLRFQAPSPLDDPTFKLLLWCMANAFCHFVPLLPACRWWVGEGYADDSDVAQGKEVLIFYCLPIAIFTWLLWNSYNIHSRLVPLSMFMEEDPVAARHAVNKLAIIDESVVFEALNRGLMRSDGEACSMKEAILEIKERELELASSAQHDGTGSIARLIDSDADIYYLTSRHGSPLQWRLDSQLWPARLLFSRRLHDEDSIHFMHMWCNFVLVAVSMQLCVLFILICQMIEDAADVMDGRSTRIMAVGVGFAHLLVCAWLAFVFVRNAFTSMNHATHRLDLLCCRRYHVDVTILGISVVAIPVAVGLFLMVIAVRIVYPFGTQ